MVNNNFGNILGIDASLSGTGIVVIDSKGTILYQENLGTKLKSYERLDYILWKVLDACTDYDIKYTAIEGYAFLGSGRITDLAELGGIIKFFLWLKNYPLDIYPPGMIKKFITGKGNVKKDLMLLKVYKKFGIEFNDDNLCDAYCIAKLKLYNLQEAVE